MSDIPDTPEQLPLLNPDKVVVIKKGSSFWKWFGITIITCFIVGSLMVLLATMAVAKKMNEAMTSMFENAGSEQSVWELAPTEKIVKESKIGDAEKKIVVMKISGVIMDEIRGSDLPIAELFKKQFEAAAKDGDVVGVILKLDTPGGEVFASDLIAKEIADFQKKTGKPVVACMEGMAASGGYYVSAPCNWIVANEITITGSIGVISSSYNYRGLMDKIGVKPVVYKSGKFKDMGRGSKAEDEILPEETAMYQGIIDKMYARFKDIVREGRNNPDRLKLADAKKLVDNWEEYADGRVFFGDEAFKLGFVDEIGGLDEAIAAVYKISNIHDASLIEYEFPFDPIQFLKKIGLQTGVNLNITPFTSQNQIELKAGKLYYLPVVE